MIGYLKGQILDTDGKKALLLTDNGVGYEINFAYYLAKNQTAEIFIHHHISENDQSLWGFQNLEDKKMFELLKTVNKVGSSKAYPLITTIGTNGLIEAIMFEQSAVLVKAPGIGKKMAEQIILSLKDKVEKFRQTTGASPSPTQGEIIESPENINIEIMQEAIMGLESLGYKDKDISLLVRKQLQEQSSLSSAEIIKNVLREL
ncbi:MAG: Holliday junction branch migration protein RuvA [Halobacteriovoraceae bacterium]|nr:Holliday junction branch migration protein RuvA [Halobacteriovoraceae bacterium]|tara:strand:- start:7082 stop:7690 length:609 start_codon:yes stop_codon:yes gene_type:complete